ncbi:aspartate aminotransferase family protein [Allostreptomyces psammosilenae]|uniref:4-aminobutyrate aminotransferase/(S)-3-amino-2-methylpropionate transaminase n=1 Tax=Allostreptomyces psammosilenae TaxID=1892865 RepID=A0A852ZSH1_9ACTN|nr:aminotransferase class III-fold pyridoxal phosphate-dependent enzyme [Allostreptomyces psammosilenae]NYI04210.1 4-aminobutyrate aminotransferase/(S)-3-amino-2-methylpropionate transaminase [Allostreptomyces psammosilenae]
MTGPGPLQRRHLEREARHLAPGASEESALARRVFTEGRGAVLTDLDGNQYLDFAAGTLTQSLGHGHPEVVAALTEQAGRLWNVHDSATPGRAELCDLLARLLPERLDTYAFFSTGAEVVEAALRVVQAVAPPGRNRIGALRHGFHGKTLGARMLVHWDIGNQSFAGNSVLGYSPYCYRCPLELERPSCGLRCATLVRRHIASKPNVSALVFEPVLGAAGVIVPPPGYWEQISEECRNNGVLLVADEVLTGGGRTGSFLASEALGAEADLVALAKGTASGFPFAVLAGRSEVLRSPAASAAGSTASTYAGNPLGIAAARATLEVVARDALVDRVRTLGDLLTDRLAALHARFDVLGDVRGLGLLHGLEFVRDRRTREPAPEIARAVYTTALDMGLRTSVGGHIIRLAPPFTIDVALLEEGAAILGRALERVTGQAGPGAGEAA